MPAFGGPNRRKYRKGPGAQFSHPIVQFELQHGAPDSDPTSDGWAPRATSTSSSSRSFSHLPTSPPPYPGEMRSPFLRKKGDPFVGTIAGESENRPENREQTIDARYAGYRRRDDGMWEDEARQR
ncbi:hypothetical protein Trydic_g14801 [Trypoxylus dichotomus]